MSPVLSKVLRIVLKKCHLNEFCLQRKMKFCFRLPDSDMSQLYYNNVKGRGDQSFYLLLILVDSSNLIILCGTLFCYNMAIYINKTQYWAKTSIRKSPPGWVVNKSPLLLTLLYIAVKSLRQSLWRILDFDNFLSFSFGQTNLKQCVVFVIV